MKACWVFAILTGCWMSSATETGSICTDYELVCLPDGHSVVVPCPDLTGEEFKFNLFKNDKVICSKTCDYDKGGLNCTTTLSRAGVKLLNVKAENKSISFKLTEVNDSSHGVYRCEGTVVFPPPQPPSVYGVGKLVLVEGHQCKMKKPPKDPQTAAEGSRDFSWIWIVLLVSLILYSVIITVCASVCWIKLKKTDSHSDYMNTKPRAPRGHRKNRGVQNPAPRYF
ncbi:T-cell-specific surface glycoprotein CD28 [Halichoeres trimaculatus]|uniref:T-cell-specific surface glycoprotein CD28 n=1 Tax=Halichoeres trimaculatus TaxID=147232 RepID=UPI003D9FA205